MPTLIRNRGETSLILFFSPYPPAIYNFLTPRDQRRIARRVHHERNLRPKAGGQIPGEGKRGPKRRFPASNSTRRVIRPHTAHTGSCDPHSHSHRIGARRQEKAETPPSPHHARHTRTKKTRRGRRRGNPIAASETQLTLPQALLVSVRLEPFPALVLRHL